MYAKAAHPVTGTPVETILRDELAHGDALIGTISPILRHLLANDEHSMFSDEIVARVRGMMSSIARQLLDAASEPAETGDSPEYDDQVVGNLVASFICHPGLLSHLHCLALEWQLTERLQARLALDPVLSPLLQALIASSESNTAGNAMALLAAQARFAQAQRRMELPLTELPGDLIHVALLALRNHAGEDDAAQARCSAAELAIRGSYDESRSRLGLVSRLVSGLGGGAMAALSVSHAGLAIFLTALALASGQDRDLVVLSANDGQLARFALALRAAGLKPQQIEEQFGAISPDAALPVGFDVIGADQAAALLARSAAYPGL